jgi:hypothetical protein
VDGCSRSAQLTVLQKSKATSAAAIIAKEVGMPNYTHE